MQAVHDSGENFSFEWRMQQLHSLQTMMRNHWDEICEALHEDLGKQKVEAVATELILVMNDLSFTMHNLKSWMKRRNVPSPGILFPSFSYIEPRPLRGPAVLIIGPFNYPILLTLAPALGALAAGNPVVLKPSELSASVSQLLQRIVPLHFEKSAVAVVTGGVPESTALLARPWGKIFLTGSPATGQLIAAAAAKTLTPVVLELGGKTPAYLDDSTVGCMQQVANRIVWSRFLNCGQTCVAVDTVILSETLLGQFLPAVKQALREQLGDDPAAAMGRIVSQKHAERLVKLLQQVEEVILETDDASKKKITKILVGGSKLCDTENRFIYPTVVLNPPADSRLMKEEIFGPILPIVSVKSRTEAVACMRQLPGTPLALYVFTDSEATLNEVRQQVPAGTVVRNDAVMQIASHHIPFGGLGTSGYGTYHGKHSFECFSHLQPILHRLCGPGADLGGLRYPPFSASKEWLVYTVLGRCPDIPVLFTRARTTAIVTTVACSVMQCVPPWRKLFWNAVLSCLEAAADGVRGMLKA